MSNNFDESTMLDEYHNTIDDNILQNNNLDKYRENIICCINSGDSKKYLGKEYNIDQINKMSQDDLIKLNNRYESKLSAQMTEALGENIIRAYSHTFCTVTGITRNLQGDSANNIVNELSENLQNDPFLNRAIKTAACKLYYTFGAYIAPLSVGMISGRHYYKYKPDTLQNNMVQNNMIDKNYIESSQNIQNNISVNNHPDQSH